MSKPTLVIVDDDRSFLEAFSIFLQDHEYHTVCASCGRDALARLQNNHVDLAIVDVNLPDISGIDVAERLRQSGRDIAFVMISSDDCPEVQARCRAAGARSFLVKPLVPEELLATIADTLDRCG